MGDMALSRRNVGGVCRKVGHGEAGDPRRCLFQPWLEASEMLENASLMVVLSEV